LFFYHLYRKFIREATKHFVEQRQPEDTS
jgi:hypothetical protein